MKRAYRDPVHRAEVLKREREIEAELFRPHSDEEFAEAAIALGRRDLVPEPQHTLPLQGGA